MAVDKFINLKQHRFTYSGYVPFTKNKEKIEKFMQTGNTNLFIGMILIKLVFNIIWLIANIKIWLIEHNQIRSWEINHLKLQVIQNIMDLKEDKLQWFTTVLLKSQKTVVLNLCQINNLQTNFINKLSENFKKEKFAISGALI